MLSNVILVMAPSHERNKMMSTRRQGDFYLISKAHTIYSEVYIISCENGPVFAVNVS